MALAINSVHSYIGNPCAIINNNNLIDRNIKLINNNIHITAFKDFERSIDDGLKCLQGFIVILLSNNEYTPF